MTIRKQILVTLLFFALFPILTGGGIAFIGISRGLSSMEQEQALFAGKAATNTMSVLNQQMELAVRTNAFWTDAHDAVDQENVAWIKEQYVPIKEDLDLDFLLVCNKNGKMLLNSGSEDFSGDMTTHPILSPVVQGQKVKSGLFITSKGLAIIGTAQILQNQGNGNSSGYLLFGQYLGQAHLETIQNITGSQVVIHYTSGQVPIALDPAFAQQANSGGSITKQVIHESTYLTAYQPIIDINGQEIATLSASIPILASVETKTNLTIIALAVLTFSTLLAVSFGIVMSNRFAGPMNITTELLKRVSEGDLREEQIQQVSSNEEIQAMRRAYSQMVQGLRALVKGANENAVTVAQSTGTLSSNAQHLGTASEEISASVQEITVAFHQVLGNVKKTVTAMQEMTSSVQQVATDSEAVSLFTQKTSDAAHAGMEVVNKTVNQMKTVMEKAKDTECIINHLGDNSQRVGQIVDVITGIAEQTNLLALNASIEAARAGEQGRGFTIVAEEVRTLAEESARSAKDIHDIISSIQKDTAEAIASMQAEMAVLDQGSHLIEKTGETFAHIEQAAVNLSVQVSNTSKQIEQMASQSQQVVAQIHSVEQGVQITTGNAERIATAAKGQLDFVKELTTSIHHLDEIAQQLKALSSQFKI
ncbi:methyl-accepting chemotaxis protein [Heliophilum fasciatum]|uniref:Methyl-accepting chemotaxis protein n=1 Tax=Heliophilum fasciatum TaxID=35700 RepID=A0A4R2RWV9_9FIRM|nr:methyl-accepting chemotaxis protein [Heliophilum fasciatum]MCW2278484.1 methyl-accepting chemotaxis protein [Heliophilum fasciatum]TCP63615.1 methyl-accepting chemotaxis protein [Heliophilum fasciatum]